MAENDVYVDVETEPPVVLEGPLSGSLEDVELAGTIEVADLSGQLTGGVVLAGTLSGGGVSGTIEDAGPLTGTIEP